jgi:hypothetical protein
MIKAGEVEVAVVLVSAEAEKTMKKEKKEKTCSAHFKYRLHNKETEKKINKSTGASRYPRRSMTCTLEDFQSLYRCMYAYEMLSCGNRSLAIG